MQQYVRRVLVLNVGKPMNGNVAERPEAFALREAHPDYVVFVCSQPGETQGGSFSFVAEYATLTGLSPEHYEVLTLADPDDLVRCYEALVACFADLRRRFPGAELLADYTAGTKSMSAALVLAAFDSEGSPEVQLRLVRGARGQQATVIPGTESFAPVSGIHDVRAYRFIALARAALKRFDYAEAAAALDEAMRRELSSTFRKQIEKARDLCRAFDAWDRYELATAHRLLEIYRRDWHSWLPVLEAIQGVVAAFSFQKPSDWTPGQAADAVANQLRQINDPVIIIVDLLFNAERRAAQARYDDAIARIYRALELLAQLRLAIGHGILTSDVDLTRVPEPLRTRLTTRRELDPATGTGEGSIRLALTQSWELLAAYPDEPLGAWYIAHAGKVRDFLATRNYSLLAHGLTPVSAEAWRDKGKLGLKLCQEALQALPSKARPKVLRHQQFPGPELLDQALGLAQIAQERQRL